jgi:hypothetical protein
MKMKKDLSSGDKSFYYFTKANDLKTNQKDYIIYLGLKIF